MQRFTIYLRNELKNSGVTHMVRVGGKPRVRSTDDEVIPKNIKRLMRVAIFGVLLLIVVFGSYRQVDSGER